MRAADGAGLAAPQIGVGLRVVIFGLESNPRYPQAEPVPIHHPRQSGADAALRRTGGGLGRLPVGSRPARLVPRSRAWPTRASILDGAPVEREAAGFHARVVQHECDHLDGILYPMRIRDFRRASAIPTLVPRAQLRKMQTPWSIRRADMAS
jgi:peptide deformylase